MLLNTPLCRLGFPLGEGGIAIPSNLDRRERTLRRPREANSRYSHASSNPAAAASSRVAAKKQPAYARPVDCAQAHGQVRNWRRVRSHPAGRSATKARLPNGQHLRVRCGIVSRGDLVPTPPNDLTVFTTTAPKGPPAPVRICSRDRRIAFFHEGRLHKVMVVFARALPQPALP